MHEEEGYPIEKLCDIAGVARSAYYKWLNQEVSEQEQHQQFLAEIILLIHYDPEVNKTYGYRRMTLTLTQWGVKCSGNSVRRIMRILGIQAEIRKKRKTYPSINPSHLAANILNRNFTAEQPNEKWCTDITEVKDAQGKKAYLSAVIDLYDLSIVAHKLSTRNDNQLVKETIDKAFQKNPGAQPQIHSDRGSQYTSYMYQALIGEYKFTQSMSRAGCCLDNQPIERFFGTLKAEYYYRHKFSHTEALEQGLDKYIDYYNWRRITIKFRGLSPMVVRRQYQMAS